VFNKGWYFPVIQIRHEFERLAIVREDPRPVPG